MAAGDISRSDLGTLAVNGERMKRVIKVFVWLLATASVVSAPVFAVIGSSGSDGTAAWAAQNIAWSILPAAYAVTAAMIIGRQPRNVIGWLLMMSALGYLTGAFTTQWSESLPTAPETVTLGLVFALAYDNFNWVFVIFPIFHLLITFPTGRLISSRWRWVAGLELMMILTMVIFSLFPQPIGPFSEAPWTVDNPIGFFPASLLDGPLLYGWSAGLAVVTIAGVASMIIRFRQAQPIEREQIKWLLFAVAIFAAFYTAASLTTGFIDGGWLGFFLAMSLTGIGLAIAIAVLRYHLFDIDRIISRTVGYTIVIGLLSGAFFGLVTLTSTLVPTQDSLAVAASTLVAAALFNPLRKRVQVAVDRRFNRSGYQAHVISIRFAATLRESLTTEQLASEWTWTVAESLQPATIGTWIKPAQKARSAPD